jgi:hypothetical protein
VYRRAAGGGREPWEDLGAMEPAADVALSGGLAAFLGGGDLSCEVESPT